MTSLRNSVNLIGRLGADPETKTFGNNRTVARFSIATNEYYRDKNGENQKETQWHNIVAFDNTAKIAEKFLAKGKEVAIHGKLNNRMWEDDKGVKHYVTEIIADEILVLSRDN
jgi:single-strand DNA-binding protein